MLLNASGQLDLSPGGLEQAARRSQRVGAAGARAALRAAWAAPRRGPSSGGVGGETPPFARALPLAWRAPSNMSGERIEARACQASYRMKNCPDGWFDPWTLEWQFTQERPNIRLLLFTLIAFES